MGPGIVASSGAATTGDARTARPKSRIFACPSRVTRTFAGFTSAVDEARLVRGREARGDLGREVEGARSGERPRRDERGERPPGDELQDEERGRGFEGDVEDGDDVRVGERRRGPRLPLQLPEGSRVRIGARGGA